MRAGGVVVNVADLAAFETWPAYVPHGISKAGVVRMTRALARALAPAVRVVGVAPGAVLLPDDWDDGSAGRLAETTPLRRLGAPADVVGAVLYLVGADYVTGETLLVDGGRVVGVRSGDKGRGREGEELSNFEPGADLIAQATVLCEGTQGHLTGAAIRHFGIGSEDPQQWEQPVLYAGPPDAVRTVTFHEQWVPFGANDWGDTLCVDLAPGPRGRVGQVIQMAGEGPLTYLADSVAGLLLPDSYPGTEGLEEHFDAADRSPAALPSTLQKVTVREPGDFETRTV